MVHHIARSEDYCLICRESAICFEFLFDLEINPVIEGDPVAHCTLPRALVGEKASRADALRTNCEHWSFVRHYETPGFTPVGFWADQQSRYHYCPNCQAMAVECPEGRNSDGRTPCTIPHTDQPLNDRRLVEIAWAASQVQAPLPWAKS